jgi:hypothetical protein
MSGFEMQIGQLQKAAKAAGSAADQAGAVSPGAGLEEIAAALPGGTAAATAPALATAFNDRAKGWADEIGRWSASVRSSAEMYSESDDAARAAFRG